jgi:hypothetical protein
MAEVNIVALPLTVNFTRLKGDTFKYTYTFLDNLGNPIDLTLLTSIVMQVRKKPGGADVLWTAFIGDGMSIQGVGNNELVISKLIALNAATYYHDLQFEYSNGDIWTPIGGTMTIITDVTVIP